MRIHRIGKRPVSGPVSRELSDVPTVPNALPTAIPLGVKSDVDGDASDSAKPDSHPPDPLESNIRCVYTRDSLKPMVELSFGGPEERSQPPTRQENSTDEHPHSLVGW